MISKKNHRVRKTERDSLYCCPTREKTYLSHHRWSGGEIAGDWRGGSIVPSARRRLYARSKGLMGRPPWTTPSIRVFQPLKQIKIKQRRKEAIISSGVPPAISRFQGKASVNQLVESYLSIPPACRPFGVGAGVGSQKNYLILGFLLWVLFGWRRFNAGFLFDPLAWQTAGPNRAPDLDSATRKLDYLQGKESESDAHLSQSGL